MRLECFQDAVDAVALVAPSMPERDLADMIVTASEDQAAGRALLDCYAAAAAVTDPTVLSRIWVVVQQAANVAGVITSIVGAVETL